MTPPDSQPARRRILTKRRLLFLFVLVLVAVWAVHPPLLAKGLRFALTRLAGEAGLTLEVADIRASFGSSWIFEGVRVRSRDAAVSRTAADIRRVEVALNWPWRAFFGEKRALHAVSVAGLRGVFDFRPEAMRLPPPVARTAEQERAEAATLRQWLPEEMALHDASAEILAEDQSYYVEDVSADFSERALGRFTAAGAEVHVAGIHENLGALTGVTAWKEGAIYLADLVLRDGVKVENFRFELARPGGPGLSLDAAVFGGSLRGSLAFGVENRTNILDGVLWLSGVQLKPLASLFNWPGVVDGVLRETRFTFRGDPEHTLDGQASLRLAADGFRWNERGWESLEIGSSLSQRRLAVGKLSLRQKNNLVSANGEIQLSDNFSDVSKAPFSLNVTASIDELGALAGLFGSPFDEMAGRMSLSSAITGQGGELEGYVTAEASAVEFRGQPVDSGKLKVTIAHNEAQIDQVELWNGRDYVRGKGSLDLVSPHHYSGDVQASVGDVGAYTFLATMPSAPSIYAGALRLRWQGDGAANAHSGAFNVALEDFVTDQTPTGLTGRFAGTYSPQNVYFSGFELQQDNLTLNTRATLAPSGVKFENAVLRARGREVADGDVFLPVDPFALFAGRPLADAIHRDALVYAQVATRGDLKVRDLLDLAGNALPAEGTVRLNLRAEGPPEALTIDGKLEGRGLGMEVAGGRLPLSTLDAVLQASGGEAKFSGRLETRGFPAATLEAAAPFGFTEAADGTWRWLNPEGRLSGRLDLPRTDLSLLQPFLPKLNRLEGVLTGGVTVAGTVGAPQVTGQLALTGGQLQLQPRTPNIGNLDALFTFATDRITIEKFTGDVAAGPFSVRGGVSLATPGNPRYDITLEGKKILLARDPGLRLRANIDLRAAGDAAGGAVTGSVRLVDGRLYQRLEITPLLVPAPSQEELFVPPRFDGLVPPPFAAWKLDVAVRNETPFQIVGNIATGEIIPDVRLGGTLGAPVPVGRIAVYEARAFLPFTTMTIKEGNIDFIASDPWMPQLNMRAVGQAMDYDVQAFAFGPLNQRKLILRSDPPLPQQALILLLTTGIAPGVYAGSGFGEAAAGQGGLLLLQAFARQFETKGVDVNSIINRLQITAVPPQFQGDRSSLRGRFRLWQGLSLMSERDSYGFYNVGVTYNFRFR